MSLGIPGPVPKRTDHLVRRNKPTIDVDKVSAIGLVRIPKLDIPDAHPMIDQTYKAMIESGQAKFFEPSDWAYARVTLHFLDGLLKSSRPSSQMLATVNQMLSSLLLTEGDRRRLRIEVERVQRDAAIAEVTSIADVYRARLEQVASPGAS
jgi:hypothetical protein